MNKKLADEGGGFPIIDRHRRWISCPEGKLDFDDDLLAELDVVVASVHQGFTQSEAETTKRLIAAAENPFVHMLGHLTGRLLLEREPYKVNQTAVIDACAATGTWIELNANPLRFDMDWRLWHYAKDKGRQVRHQLRRPPQRTRRSFCASAPASRAKAGWKQRTSSTPSPLAALQKELNASGPVLAA